jgi:hypothetical protein
MSDAADPDVSAEELAGWLACSAMSVAVLARRGVIERMGRGRYPLRSRPATPLIWASWSPAAARGRRRRWLPRQAIMAKHPATGEKGSFARNRIAGVLATQFRAYIGGSAPLEFLVVGRGPAQPLNSASGPKSKLDTQTEASRKLRLRVVNLAATPRNPTATARVIAADCRRSRRQAALRHGRADGANRAVPLSAIRR